MKSVSYNLVFNKVAKKSSFRAMKGIDYLSDL